MIISDVMERNGRKTKAADFIELLSQELPWDDIDRVLDSQSCCKPENEFNPDDLSLFNAFVDSLPSVAAQASCDTEALVPVDEVADTGMNVASDIETDFREEDFDCSDEISVCSQIEDIMVDILDGKRPADNDNEVGEHSDADDSALNPQETELQCGVGSSSNNWSTMNEITMVEKNSGPADTASSNSSAAEQNKAGCDVRRAKQLDMSDDCEDSSDDDDNDELTSSQEWLCDQIHNHLVRQHDEALRVNRLRVRLPPLPGDTSVGRDPISRASHAFSTEIEATKLNIKLTDALRADNPSASDCCKLLDDYNPYNLSPGVLVQYPFFAGVVDTCCRWEGNLQHELRTAARWLRGFMMAMYARHSVDEGFLTALNRQVTGHRRALAVPANATKLTKLIRKHRKLSGLPEFYRSLYEEWDMFMTQFNVPDDERRDNENFSNDDRWTHRWESNSAQKRADTACRPTRNVATRSNRATVSDQPISDVAGVSEIPAVNANPMATGPQSETDVFAPVLSAQTADAQMSASKVASTMMNRQSSRMRSAVSMNCDVKPDPDETVEHTLYLGHRRSAIEELGLRESLRHRSLVVEDRRLRPGKRNVSEASAESEDVKPCDIVTAKRRRGRPRKCASVSRVEGTIEPDDIKPVIGSLHKRRNRYPKQSTLTAYSKTTGSKSGVEDGRPAYTGFEEPDVKPDLASLNVNVPSADADVTVNLRRGRSRKRTSASSVEHEDIKPVIRSTEKRTDRNPKQSTLSAYSKTVVTSTPVCTSFEQQDVKPDLASLDVSATAAIPDVTSRLRRGRSRKSASVSGVESDGVKQVIGSIEKRSDRNPKQSKLSAYSKTVATATPVCTSFEEQDMKPDLASLVLNIAAADPDVTTSLQTGRSRKRASDGSVKPDGMKQVIGSTEKRIDRNPKQSKLSAYSKTVATSTPVCTSFEEEDVKPDLASLVVNVAAADPDVTTSQRRGRSRKRASDSSVEPDGVKQVIGSIEKRSDRNPKQSSQSAYSKTVATATPVCTSFEQQDVKPDLASLNINVPSAAVDVTANLRRGRSRKADVSIADTASIGQVIGTVYQGGKCKERQQSCQSVDRHTRTKNVVEVTRGTAWTGREEKDQDVKPDLRFLEVTAGRTRRDRPKRSFSGQPATLTSSMKELHTTTAASDGTNTGEKRARGSGERWFQCDVCLKLFHRKINMIRHKRAESVPRTEDGRFPCDICTKTFAARPYLWSHRHLFHDLGPLSYPAAATPPATNASFRLLSPSQIKVEVES